MWKFENSSWICSWPTADQDDRLSGAPVRFM